MLGAVVFVCLTVRAGVSEYSLQKKSDPSQKNLFPEIYTIEIETQTKADVQNVMRALFIKAK